MVAGCGVTCVKYVFFTVNFFIFLCGVAVLGVSIWARLDSNFQNKIDKAITDNQKSGDVPVVMSNMFIALYVLMAVGSLLLICGFIGCTGACCENTCLLGLFFAIMLLMLLTEIAGAIYIFVTRNNGTLKEHVRAYFKTTLFDQQNNVEAQRQVLQLENSLNCCGYTGCVGTRIEALSQACCALRKGAPSCTDVLYDSMNNNFLIVGIVAICLVVVELLAMIFACILCNGIRSTDRYSYY